MNVSSIFRKINWFFTANLVGVAILSFILGAFNESLRTESGYWWSRLTNNQAWDLYDRASERLVLLDGSPVAAAGDAYTEAMEDLRRAAEAGISQAMLDYGQVLCRGRPPSVVQNRGEGRYWIEKAALAGHPRAKIVACQNTCR
jgi:TPR repeat protein